MPRHKDRHCYAHCYGQHTATHTAHCALRTTLLSTLLSKQHCCQHCCQHCWHVNTAVKTTLLSCHVDTADISTLQCTAGEVAESTRETGCKFKGIYSLTYSNDATYSATIDDSMNFTVRCGGAGRSSTSTYHVLPSVEKFYCIGSVWLLSSC